MRFVAQQEGSAAIRSHPSPLVLTGAGGERTGSWSGVHAVGVNSTHSFEGAQAVGFEGFEQEVQGCPLPFRPENIFTVRLLLYTVLYWSTSLTISKYAKLVVVLVDTFICKVSTICGGGWTGHVMSCWLGIPFLLQLCMTFARVSACLSDLMICFTNQTTHSQ